MDLADSKTEKVAHIIRQIYQSPIKNLLVVGCGEGIEAAILAQQLETEVTGIDLKDEFDERARRYAKLQKGDALNLDLANESFDFVFSYHALEHIENPSKALLEMRRILKKGGGYWIGTPNKARIAGYIGGKNTLLSQKIKWNLVDWRARLTGTFKNELGAHAGFTSAELHELLSAVFPAADEVTNLYFSTIYENRRALIESIIASGFARFIFPSVYFSGVK